MHKAWSSIEDVPYCFSRSSVKFQGHIALKIVEFDSNWAFLDCNSSLNSPMAMKCCTKLETAKKRCPIVFQGHPSNFKVTRDKTSPILTQIGRFRTIGCRNFQIPQICLVQNSCVSRLLTDLCETKKKANQILGWLVSMVLLFDYTHDLDLEVSRSKFEITWFNEWEGWLTWNEMDVSWSFMTMTYGLPLCCVWMYRVINNRGELRCRLAVGISCLNERKECVNI